MPTLRSGEVARLANVNVETLRFYERQGLLPRPPQRASGYREYPPEAVSRVRFIQRAKELGFMLNEVKASGKLKSTKNWSIPASQERGDYRR